MTATLTAAFEPLAASPAVRLPGARRRAPPGWPIAASVLLHVALLVLAIVAAHHKRTLTESTPPASFAMVFEGGGKTPASVANPAPISPNHEASPAPQPSSPPPPPVERATPAPPPPVPPVITPPAPPVVAPAPQAVAPPPVTPPAPQVGPPAEQAPPSPAPAPPIPLQPLPEIPAPATPAPAARIPAPEAVPLPPPAVPVPLPQAGPRTAALRPTAPPRASPAFPAPMDFSLGPRAIAPDAAAEAAPSRPHASAGTIDMSFAPMMGGGDITQLHPQGKGDDVGADWFSEVAAWWLRHRFYPSEAGRLQQEGDVTLRLVVARDGRVDTVDLESRSGSPWLDMGAIAVFRGAKLPPLPPDVRDPDVTVQFTIHYLIVR